MPGVNVGSITLTITSSFLINWLSFNVNIKTKLLLISYRFFAAAAPYPALSSKAGNRAGALRSANSAIKNMLEATSVRCPGLPEGPFDFFSIGNNSVSSNAVNR